MKRIWIGLVIVVVLIAGLFIYNEMNAANVPPAQMKACWWVFKTNGDYSDMQLVINLNRINGSELHIDSLLFPRIDIPNIDIHTGGTGPLDKLDQNYLGHVYGCSFPSTSAFANISMSKWETELMECIQPLKDYEENLVLKYCNDSKFLWGITPVMIDTPAAIGVESNNSATPWDGQMHAAAQSGEQCDFKLSNEENLEFQQKRNWRDCTARVNNNYGDEATKNSIIDTKPFTEFYLCKNANSIDEVNAIINNSELSIKCQKKV